MDHKKRERTTRKEFWIPFIVFVIPIIIFISIYGDISSELFFFLIFIVAGLYIAGYVNGYRQGKEAIRQVLDYLDPSLRWKVLNAETKCMMRQTKSIERIKRVHWAIRISNRYNLN